MNNEKLNRIINILKENYEGEMSDAHINAYANELNYSLFTGCGGLDDISCIIFENEEEAGIKTGKWDYVFHDMVDLLEDGEVTAKRLYNCFMYDLDSLNVFIKLIILNSEYLTEEEIKSAKEKAFGVFDNETLKMYGITE